MVVYSRKNSYGRLLAEEDEFEPCSIKRESGANPERSRHCDSRSAAFVTEVKPWEGAGDVYA